MQGMASSTPAGIALLSAGLLYFMLFGQFVLPKAKGKEEKTISMQQRLIDRWRLPNTIYQCIITSKSPLVGKTREEAELWTKHRLNLLALADGDDVLYAPWRHTPFAAGQRLALLGDQTDLVRFVSEYELMFRKDMKPFEPLETAGHAGFQRSISTQKG